MDDKSACPVCGSELPADSPRGLCARCLLREGAAAVPRRAEDPPPKPGELAPLFPDLDGLELIGRGGMGVVYKARQRKLDRPVALKILPPDADRDPSFADRFLREARALARLNHPNIVSVYEFGENGGFYFIVMEYVDGRTLREVSATGGVTPQQALAIVPEICAALQYAHDAGVVHRDIKPENILLDRDGVVKIADFGLAKLTGAEATTHLTRAEQVMGTPSYMAPEQHRRPLEVDHRADIYSLGVVFYELLTGELPQGHFEPPSSRSKVDARIDPIVLRSLAQEPDRRYQRVDEVKSAVENVASSTDVLAAAIPDVALPVEDKGKRPLSPTDVYVILGLFGGLLVTGVLVWFWTSFWVPVVCVSVLFMSLHGYRLHPTAHWVAKIVATVGILAILGLGMYMGGGVWWLTLLVFVVMAWGDDDRVRELPTDIGLSDEEKMLWHILDDAGPTDSYFKMLPKVGGDVVSTVRKRCDIPRTERIIATIDLTYWGTGKACVGFTSQAVYFRNRNKGVAKEQRGPFRIPYAELATREIVSQGDGVFLGTDEQTILPDTDWIDWYPKACDEMTACFQAIKRAMIAYEGGVAPTLAYQGPA